MKIIVIVLVIIATVAFMMIRSWHKIKNTPVPEDNELIEKVSADNFDARIKKGVVLVDFWAEWCMPCRMMAPVLNEVAQETEGVASVYKLNVDENQQVAARFGIRGIPTMILFRDGREVERIVGMKPKEYIISAIEKAGK